MSNTLSVGVTLLAFYFQFQAAAAGIGSAFNYQGRLKTGGQPATGRYDFRFGLYTAETNGARAGVLLTNANQIVTEGCFSVTLDFGAGTFDGVPRWLEIGVRTNGSTADFVALTPRQAVLPAPQAQFAAAAGTAAAAASLTGQLPDTQLSANIPRLGGNQTFTGAVQFSNPANTFTGNGAGLTNLNAWQLGGNSGASNTFLGTVDASPLELRVGNQRALRIEPGLDAANIVGGHPGNAVSAGLYSATIAGGGGSQYNLRNLIQSDGSFGAIGGGRGNIVRGTAAAIAGGSFNETGGEEAAVGGGWANYAYTWATVAGGFKNRASAQTATVAGGAHNTNEAVQAFVGGGSENLIRAGSDGAVISGGRQNKIADLALHCVIGGGRQNTNEYGTRFSVIGGGTENTIQSNVWGTAIVGGRANTARHFADYATIAGGQSNAVGSAFAFAAGRFAQALHTGAFVWADAAGTPWSSTHENQFLIRAQGGVGIGTNNPQAQLHVAGTVKADAFVGSGAGLSGLSATQMVGILPPASFPTNVARTDVAQTFTGMQTFRSAAFADEAGPGGSLRVGKNATGGDNKVIYFGDGGFVQVGESGEDDRLFLKGTSTYFQTAGIGLGVLPAADAFLTINGTVRINENDLYLRSGADNNHGLGYYGAGKLFGGINLDGPVVYGCDGGGLGVACPSNRLALRWQANGNVTIDPHNLNDGTLARSLIFGNGSGEGLASKRTAGGNQHGLDFYTSFNVRMSIANNGNVGIGAAPSGYKLHVNGSVAGVGAYNNLSDARLKRDIAPIEGALDKVLRLRGVSYDWRRDEFPDLAFDAGRQLGFVAQEVESVLPEAVTQGSDGIYSVAYSKVVPVLVEAVKEQNQKADTQAGEISRLKTRNAELEQRLADLEKIVARLAAERTGN